LTVDTYGKWLPMGDKNAVNGLDDDRAKRGNGSKTVARRISGTPDALEVPEIVGAGGGI
jgi:hypothetical protein